MTTNKKLLKDCYVCDQPKVPDIKFKYIEAQTGLKLEESHKECIIQCCSFYLIEKVLESSNHSTEDIKESIRKFGDQVKKIYCAVELALTNDDTAQSYAIRTIFKNIQPCYGSMPHGQFVGLLSVITSQAESLCSLQFERGRNRAYALDRLTKSLYCVYKQLTGNKPGIGYHVEEKKDKGGHAGPFFRLVKCILEHIDPSWEAEEQLVKLIKRLPRQLSIHPGTDELNYPVARG